MNTSTTARPRLGKSPAVTDRADQGFEELERKLEGSYPGLSE